MILEWLTKPYVVSTRSKQFRDLIIRKHVELPASERIMKSVKKEWCDMQYKPRADADKENVSVRLSDSESELQSQLDSPALEPEGGYRAPEKPRPQKSQILPERHEAMAASVPGSEYWLP